MSSVPALYLNLEDFFLIKINSKLLIAYMHPMLFGVLMKRSCIKQKKVAINPKFDTRIGEKDR